jgi:hypothetical protein
MSPRVSDALAAVRRALAALAAALVAEGITPDQRVAVGRLLTLADGEIARAITAAGQHPKGGR